MIELRPATPTELSELDRLLSLARPHPAERDLDTLLTAVERFLDPSAERFATAYRELRETATEVRRRVDDRRRGNNRDPM